MWSIVLTAYLAIGVSVWCHLLWAVVAVPIYHGTPTPPKIDLLWFLPATLVGLVIFWPAVPVIAVRNEWISLED